MWPWRVKMPTQNLLRLLLLLILIICNLSSRSVKGKVISCRLHIHMILNSQQRDSEGIGGNIWRCRKKYHVTSVRRHLQVGVAFPSTNRPRVGSRSPVAQSVTSRLLRILNWRGTPSSTPERDLTSAHSATFHATGLTPSNCISRSTLGKNFTNAINACNYSFNNPASLKRHIKKHTGENLYNCNQCEHKTTQSGALQTHKKTHSGEKPNRCTSCKYSCITTRDLKIHVMRMHTREKPFKCKQCNYACTTSSNLQQHMRKHSGERPFKCNQCSKAYKEKRDLAKHVKVHI